MKRCALLTCEDLSDYVTDESYLEQALKEAGWDYEWVQWKDSDVDWHGFTCAIVRTTWDYTKELDLFLEKLKQIDQSGCRLFNDYSVIHWNSNKGYLKDLSDNGISVISTLWEKYQGVEQIERAFEVLKTDRLVIKPRVSAGAIDTFLISRQELPEKEELLKVLLQREIMIQPYLKQVAEEGEHSAHYFNGVLSHVVLKKPKPGIFVHKRSLVVRLSLLI